MFPLSVFNRKKDANLPLAMVALSDAPSAQIACDAGIDAILVGDSLGNTALGFDSTIPVTMDMMAHHVAAVIRGVKSSSRPDVPVIADLTFGSYATVEKGVENAVRLMQLGAHAVKLEGTQTHARNVEGDSREESPLFAALSAAGIPVMGHIGFTPQSQLVLGAVVQGKTRDDAQKLWEQAHSLEANGCFAIVLEAMTEELARKITADATIPTVGIGAGNGCDGQVLVWHDLVGISAKTFKMAKAYAQTRQIWTEALTQYKREVEEKSFPASENAWQMDPQELARWSRENLEMNGKAKKEDAADEAPPRAESFVSQPLQADEEDVSWNTQGGAPDQANVEAYVPDFGDFEPFANK